MFILDFIKKIKSKHRNYLNGHQDKRRKIKDQESKLRKQKQSIQNRNEVLLTLTTGLRIDLEQQSTRGRGSKCRII